MIIDTLENLGFYAGINPLFKDVIEFLKTNDLNALEEGKYPIKGADLFLGFEDDEAGKLPRDLKRGVLSEDGIYDFLDLRDTVMAKMAEVAQCRR